MNNYGIDIHDRILLYLLQGKADSYLSAKTKKKGVINAQVVALDELRVK